MNTLFTMIGWRNQEVPGARIVVSGREITPYVRVIEVVWPRGGLFWIRPSAVEVTEINQTYRLAIHDRTLNTIGLILLVAFNLIIAVGAGLLLKRRTRQIKGGYAAE